MEVEKSADLPGLSVTDEELLEEKDESSQSEEMCTFDPTVCSLTEVNEVLFPCPQSVQMTELCPTEDLTQEDETLMTSMQESPQVAQVQEVQVPQADETLVTLMQESPQVAQVPEVHLADETLMTSVQESPQIFQTMVQDYPDVWDIQDDSNSGTLQDVSWQI